MDAYRQVVVTVTGVGESAPGETLRCLAAALPGPPGSYQRADLVLGGEIYPRLVNSAPALPDLIEVDGAGITPPPRSWAGAGPALLGLLLGLPALRFEWCAAAPSVRVCQAFREVAAVSFLWAIWLVLLTLVHTVVAPVARTHALLLDVALLALLAGLARSQWHPARRVTLAGYVWLGLGSALCLSLWLLPRWVVAATGLSIRVYGLTQLLALGVVLLLAAEIGLRVWRGQVPGRQGLTALAAASVPLGLAATFNACVYALVLNATLALGSPPVLEGLKTWQQTYLKTLGYHLATAEWVVGLTGALVALLILAGAWPAVTSGRGETSRRWLNAAQVTMVVLLVVGGIVVLLTSPYLGAPLARPLQRLGAGRDPLTLYTWSAVLRLLPWAVLLATPAGIVLDGLCGIGFYIMPAGAGAPSSRQASQERLARLLEFLDRGRCDRVHVMAHQQGAMVALDVLSAVTVRHPLTLTTLGSPAGTLYQEWLGWPVRDAPEWCNLYRADDPLAGPVGVEGVDAPLPGGGTGSYWSEAFLAERILQVMRQPLEAKA